MFGVFSRFFGQVWEGLLYTAGTDSVENNTRGELLGENSQESAQSNGGGVQLQQGLSTLTQSEACILTKNVSGKVTKLYDDSGIINDEIYFSFDRVIGGIRPKLGAEVHVEATRKSNTDGWRADRVEILLPDWNSAGENTTPEVVVGEITELMEQTFVVNADILCNVGVLAFGYVPSKGDWVRAEVLKDRGVVCEVRNVSPLRERSFCGCITAVNQGHGYIDKSVFFSLGVCARNYTPRRGHNVNVTAIESNQGRCRWRAVKVLPKTPSRREAGLGAAPPPQSKFRQELLRDKHGITITANVDFGDITSGTKEEKVICIRNMGEMVVFLKSIEGVDNHSAFTIQLEINKGTPRTSSDDKNGTQETFNVAVHPGDTVHFRVVINTRFLGQINQLVVFHFDSFQIGRYFVANVCDAQQQYLDARRPYQKRAFVDKKNALVNVVNTRSNQQWVIPGERPVFQQRTINISAKLKQYEIPRTLRQFVLERMDLCCLVPSLGESLSMRNHQERFATLLHIEEVQMELEMREFDLQHASLKAVGELLSLSVPGLAEGRPSLLIGDRVILSVSGASANTPKYEGFIHEVLSEDILLKFHDDFHVTFDMDNYDVMFFFNRTSLRRAHKALEMANFIGERVLFPTAVIPTLPRPVRALSKTEGQTSFNKQLNERQTAAVTRILAGQCRPMPYVLFGPPGTGKTVTLVEAILQVFHRATSSRVLACAPSNSAADLIAERLHQSGAIVEGDMVRLNAFQRQQNIPEDIENYSRNIEQLDMAAHYRIVVCTCTTSGQLHTLGLPSGHFTHVFIDEAGQATEPESLVPISFLVGTDGQTILAGDPHQLGAVLRSPTAKAYGLDISLLERLMTLAPYQRNSQQFSDHGSYDPLTVTKLVNNYRAHEALLQVPSTLFYHSELVPCADEPLKNCLCDFGSLPNKHSFPILFHGIKGEDLREGNSPSWFNAVETVQVIRYVQELRSFRKRPVELSDIGIITPYRKQVEKIRLLLERLGISQVKVGSVEEFQGQERLVIIISTVRSCPNLLDFDLTHNLGFLSNPKRFNVAITRAQALMIVVGNPHVLFQDTNWRSLLQYCVRNNAYVGCELPDLSERLLDYPDEDDDVTIDGMTSSSRDVTGHNMVLATEVTSHDFIEEQAKNTASVDSTFLWDSFKEKSFDVETSDNKLKNTAESVINFNNGRVADEEDVIAKDAVKNVLKTAIRKSTDEQSEDSDSDLEEIVYTPQKF